MQTTAVALKNKLREKRPLLGGFVFSGDSNIPEIYAECGFDFVIIDTEHALNDLRSVHAHLRACAGAGIHAIVRLGAANFPDAPRLLDDGAEGIMIPHLGHGAGTKDILASMKYFPDGSRPTCTGVQMAGYGLRNFAECAEQSNRNVLSIGLVEDRECVESIDRVLDETRVDWIMPGPADLASSLGLHGKLTHPTVRAATETVIAAAHKKDIAVGVYVNDPAEIAGWTDKGVSFFVYSIDYKVLAKSLRNAASACREAFAATSELTKA
jgi:2-keto-3-deoxy-L-rhamnonate aldolase RhmA